MPATEKILCSYYDILYWLWVSKFFVKEQKMQPSKFEGLIVFINQCMYPIALPLASRRGFERLYKMEDFYRTKGGIKELLGKENKVSF